MWSDLWLAFGNTLQKWHVLIRQAAVADMHMPTPRGRAR